MLHRFCQGILWTLAIFIAFVITGLCFAAPAQATDLTLSWNPVTTDSTGATLPAGNSVSYNVYGAQQGQPLKLLANVLTTTNVRTNVNPGIDCYAVSAVLTSVEGAQTAPICVTVAAPPPTPAVPAGFAVTPTAMIGGPFHHRVMYVFDRSRSASYGDRGNSGCPRESRSTGCRERVREAV